MSKSEYKKPKANKFTKAIRNECDFDDAYLKKEIEEHYLENINVFADDLLCGLKSIKKKAKKEQKEYLEKLVGIFKKYKLDKLEYDECYLGTWDNNYPAPSNGFYVNKVIKDIKDKKFKIDKSINELEQFIKNSKKPFEKKVFSDEDVKYICDHYFEDLTYDDFKERLKKYKEIIEKGCDLGYKKAIKWKKKFIDLF